MLELFETRKYPKWPGDCFRLYLKIENKIKKKASKSLVQYGELERERESFERQSLFLD